ncbi:MAG: roadblock/LC7 domain-containing protein [Neisseriaceae bacterium]|nr:roadblock/LC7 domain-containing protein [Neisseriaceae bacterium]
MSNPLEEILQELHNQTSDIISSAIVSSDGLPVASVLADESNEDRVGGMTAAMLSLGQRATRELFVGNLAQTTIQGDDGLIQLIQATDDLVLVLTTVPDAKLGMILFYARQAAKKIKALDY